MNFDKSIFHILFAFEKKMTNPNPNLIFLLTLLNFEKIFWTCKIFIFVTNPNLIVCYIMRRQTNNRIRHMLYTTTTYKTFSLCLEGNMFWKLNILNFCHVLKTLSSDSLTFWIFVMSIWWYIPTANIERRTKKPHDIIQ